MKQSTVNKMDNTASMIARVFIDRRLKKDTAVLAEKRQIIKATNVTCAYLYDYYVSICQVPSWDLTDDSKIARQCGLSVRQVRDARLKLTNEGWIRFETHKHKSVKYGLWYIGKEVVAYRITQESSLEDFYELGILLGSEGITDE